MKLLIIEDEKELSASISEYLQGENFYCEFAYDKNQALEKIAMNSYDCILLDLMLPNGNGLDVLTELKHKSKEDSVLIISAKNALEDKVNGLKLGADDYLTKPFNLAELGARIHAIIRRKSFNGNNQLKIGPLKLDIQNNVLTGPNGIVDLTRKQFDLLVFFIANKNKVITKETIVEHLWGDNFDMVNNYDFIYTHIKNLRKKLMAEGCPNNIKVIYGVGYKFELN
jgi:DNA-binding response OmpR family regulator